MSPFPSALACHFVEGRKANNDGDFIILLLALAILLLLL